LVLVVRFAGFVGFVGWSQVEEKFTIQPTKQPTNHPTSLGARWRRSSPALP
jgi:hypothetical protein